MKATKKEVTSNKTAAVLERAAPVVGPVARKMGVKRAPAVAAVRDEAGQVAKLRALVGEHKRLANTIQQWESSIKARKFKDGTVAPPAVKSPVAVADISRAIATLKAEQADLVKAMAALLGGIPIYDEFLSKVFGVGAGVLAAYLVAMVRIERCPNVSNLIRYCGNACDPATGRIERRHAAPKAQGGEGSFNSDLRRNNYLITSFMRQNGARPVAGAPNGRTTKYLERWYAASYGRRTTGRAMGADSAGRAKATDLFLWDLYVMWRTLEGLDIRPDKYSAIRGRWHNGADCVDARYTLTTAEAREVVGDVGARPLDAKRVWSGEIETAVDEAAE